MPEVEKVMLTMLTSQARVATDRAGRYLAQLCEHGGKMGHPALRRFRGHGHDRAGGDDGGPPEVRRAEWSEFGADAEVDASGVIDFGWGRCTLRATAGELLLRAEADDERSLRRIEEGIAARVQRIGRRDMLSVTWDRDPGGAEAEAEAEAGADEVSQ